MPSPTRRATPASPEACAQALLEVVPHAMDAIRAAMRAQVGGDLSVPQFRCLAFIAREGQASVGSVAAFIGVTLPTASAMIDRLVRAGSVSAVPDANDRRRLLLQPTAAGRQLLQHIRHDAHQGLSAILAQRSSTELSALLRGLEVLGSAFGDATQAR